MSMVTDIEESVRKAVGKNLTPQSIRMSYVALSRLADVARREDEERRHFAILVIDHAPHIYNPFTEAIEPIIPSKWFYKDTKRGIDLQIPIEVSEGIPDDQFALLVKHEPPPRIEQPKRELDWKEPESLKDLDKPVDTGEVG